MMFTLVLKNIQLIVFECTAVQKLFGLQNNGKKFDKSHVSTKRKGWAFNYVCLQGGKREMCIRDSSTGLPSIG